jgi:AraC-like DNA-binding protein
MAEGETFSFSDPDGYAASFGNARVNLTITGAGDFRARLTWLKLTDLEIYRCCEDLPRIAYISLPPGQIFLSFPLDEAALISDGFALRNGHFVLHDPGERTHQRSDGACRWGLISLSSEQFTRCGEALTGLVPAQVSRIMRPARAQALKFQRLFRHACHLVESKHERIERPEAAGALEQEMLHAIINCVSTSETEDNQTRQRHAAIMVRFEEMLSERIDQKPNLPLLCAKIGVPERTLRLCCVEFLGLSPTRYLLLRRLNKARAALRRGAPSTTSVAEVARNHQFQELGRFAVTYRAAFGESPSVTLQRDPRIYPAGNA